MVFFFEKKIKYKYLQNKGSDIIKKIIVILNILILGFVSFYEFNYLPSKKELSIVSYNIHSGLDKYMFPTLFDTMNFLKNLDADIICLQEVNESSKAGFQVSSFKEELNMYSYFGANVLKSGNNYGSSIHSKYPIKYQNHIYLTSKKEQRGMLHTTISIKGQKIDIINLHLGLNEEEQEIQINEMLTYLKRLDNPYIVVGDFNNYNLKIDEDILVDTAKATGNANTLTLQAGLERIDYIFVSPKIDIIDYEVLIESMSDHYPIKAKIKF